MGEGGSFRKSYIDCVLLLIGRFSCVCALDFFFFFQSLHSVGKGHIQKKNQTGGGGGGGGELCCLEGSV